MDYQQAKAARDEIQCSVDAAGAVLKAYPKSGPMGLTPEHIRLSGEYREAKATYDRAFSRLRAFNAAFVRRFAAELRAERSERRSVLG